MLSSKETTDVTVTGGTLWSDKVFIILALLNKFVYEFRGNTTYVIQEKTALDEIMSHISKLLFFFKILWGLYEPYDQIKCL